jgi:hypothetical protein
LIFSYQLGQKFFEADWIKVVSPLTFTVIKVFRKLKTVPSDCFVTCIWNGS